MWLVSVMCVVMTTQLLMQMPMPLLISFVSVYVDSVIVSVDVTAVVVDEFAVLPLQ